MAAGVAVSGLPQLAAATSAAKGVSKSQKASPQNAVWNHDQVALLIIDYQPEMFAAILREKDLTKGDTFALCARNSPAVGATLRSAVKPTPLTLKLTSRLPGCEKLRCSLHGETSIARPWKEDHRLGWRGQRGAGTAVTQQLGRALDFVDDHPVKTADESGGIGLRSGEDRLVVQRDVAAALLIHLSHERGFARPARPDDHRRQKKNSSPDPC
jgi:hypothetical protein